MGHLARMQTLPYLSSITSLWLAHKTNKQQKNGNKRLAEQKDGSAEHIYAMNRHLKIKTYEMTLNFSPFRLR